MLTHFRNHFLPSLSSLKPGSEEKKHACRALKATEAGPPHLGNFPLQKELSHWTSHLKCVFLCDFATKRFLQSPPAQAWCRKGRGSPLQLAGVTTSCGKGHSTLGSRMELAPERLPCDASSRKPSRTSFSLTQRKLGSDPRSTHVPLSQSSVPPLIAASLALRDKVCLFLLFIPGVLLLSEGTEGGGEVVQPPLVPQ